LPNPVFVKIDNQLLPAIAIAKKIVNLEKLPTVNSRSLGENPPNLVTLILAYIYMYNTSFALLARLGLVTVVAMSIEMNSEFEVILKFTKSGHLPPPLSFCTQ
jgi:hypothetical protein